MKQRLRGTEYIDAATPNEISNIVHSHTRKALEDRFATFHVEYRTIVEQFSVDGAGNLNTDEYLNPNSNNDGNSQLGPAAGYAWDVKRIIVIGATAAGTIGLYINGTNASNVVDFGGVIPQKFLWSSQQFVMRPNEVLYVVGSGLAANSIVTLTGQVKEVPLNALGRLNI